MDGSPPPSEGAEESTAREDETQEVSDTPEESGEVMEVSYGRLRLLLLLTATPRNHCFLPERRQMGRQLARRVTMSPMMA